MKVLLTGFDAFGGDKINPALMTIEAIAKQSAGTTQIVTCELPTVFGKSAAAVIEAIDRENPSIVVSLGLYAGSPEIHVERVAINCDDARIPDNEKKQPVDQPVVEGAPAAYFATLPVKKIVQRMRDNGVPACVSNSAGTFVCNHVMFSVLHHIASKGLPIRAGFIHVPCVPEQAVDKQAVSSMSLDTIKKAVMLAVEACVEE